ncbi:MAG: hypothetical protein NVSMB29_02780 [Candidatus Dormibacteria bacterium]
MRRLRSPFALALILGVAGLAAAIVAFVFANALSDLRSPLHPLRPPASASPAGSVGPGPGGSGETRS